MFERFFGTTGHQRNAETLYLSAVQQARSPGFYAEMGVPDTVDGRFEMIAIHVFLILRCLKKGGEKGDAIGQALFDAMFLDMDRGLRELGAGDLGVGRRVKVMAKAFYGRIAAYERGLDDGDAALAEAIQRNIFRDDGAAGVDAEALASYMRTQASALENQPLEDVLNGRAAFTDLLRTANIETAP